MPQEAQPPTAHDCTLHLSTCLSSCYCCRSLWPVRRPGPRAELAGGRRRPGPQHRRRQHRADPLGQRSPHQHLPGQRHVGGVCCQCQAPLVICGGPGAGGGEVPRGRGEWGATAAASATAALGGSGVVLCGTGHRRRAHGVSRWFRGRQLPGPGHGRTTGCLPLSTLWLWPAQPCAAAHPARRRRHRDTGPCPVEGEGEGRREGGWVGFSQRLGCSSPSAI